VTQKDYAIDTFELAQWNVLRAIMRLKPKDLEYQITPNINPIRWILGHLTWHMDHIFNRQCRGTSQLTKEEREYFTSGAQGVVEREFPFSLMHLIETFLDVSESSFQYLRELPDEKLNEPPAKSETKDAETIYELLQRVSLHFLGHTGQIYLIKKELGKGGYFVTGVRKKGREDSRKKWLKWWNENKDEFED
jgi:uncharacterized damage-inducible protein DinB